MGKEDNTIIRTSDENPLKIFKCRNCGGSLGKTDGRVFVLNTISIPFKVEFVCLNCGEKQIWRPVYVV